MALHHGHLVLATCQAAVADPAPRWGFPLVFAHRHSPLGIRPPGGD